MSDVFMRGHEWEDDDGAASYPSYQPAPCSGKRKRERDTLRCRIGDLGGGARLEESGEIPDRAEGKNQESARASKKKKKTSKALGNDTAGGVASVEIPDQAGEGKTKDSARASKKKKKKKTSKVLENDTSGGIEFTQGKSETPSILVDKLEKKGGKRGKRVRFDLGDQVQVEPSGFPLLQQVNHDSVESMDMPGLEIVDDLFKVPDAVDFVKPDRTKKPKKSGKKGKGKAEKRLVEMVLDMGEESEELEEIFDSEEDFGQEIDESVGEPKEEVPSPEKLKKQKKEKKKDKKKKRKEKGLNGTEGSEPVMKESGENGKSDVVVEGKEKGKCVGKKQTGVIEATKKMAKSKTEMQKKGSEGGRDVEEKLGTSGRTPDGGLGVEEKGSRSGLGSGKSIFDVREVSLSNKKPSRMSKLLTKFHDRLLSGHFRYLNEKLYNGTGEENFKMMHKDRSLFEQYHRDYTQQMKSWPQLPVDVAIDWLQKNPEEWKVADFGCGEARLERAVSQEVSSLDLVALVPEVIECNMAKTPLESASHDCAVFCLALMGKDYFNYLKEAARILKPEGVLWIAEVCSRFVNQEGREEYEAFNAAMKAIGFESSRQYWPNKVFVVMIFKKKEAPGKGTRTWPKLKNCAYKKR